MKLLKYILLLTVVFFATSCTPTNDTVVEEEQEDLNSLTGGADAGTIDDGKD